MNNVPMRFDYSKTINEQLPTFEYYKNRYVCYELQIMNLQKIIDKAIEYIEYIGMDATFDKVLIEILKGEDK